MFRGIFAHPQECKTRFYSMWYNAPKLLLVPGLERGGTDYVFGVKNVVSSFTPNTVSSSAFQATYRQQLGCIIPHAVKHGLALLRMDKNLPETY